MTTIENLLLVFGISRPRYDGGVTTNLHKLGRRIGTVSALMVAADDVPLARAVADIQCA
ncbi:MAG TPA: hypothetical protein VMS16_00325 [Mycobacterium sp.]|nr:hypothetical protein [Mycobacterium sp.]